MWAFTAIERRLGSKTFGSAFFLTVGGVFLVVGILDLRETQRVLAEGELARVKAAGRHRSGGRSTNYSVDVEFQTRAGVRVRLTESVGRGRYERTKPGDREYTLRGSESRTLATVGAFRVVSSRDLRGHDGSPADPRSGDLRHLRKQGLIETARLPGYRDPAAVLTKEGRSLLQSHRDRDHEHYQTFYAGLAREREFEHDLQVYRAYEQAEARLVERGAHIERVVLDHELKGEYQHWLHERDKDHDDYDGHPDRTPDEIREWAYEHELPYFDDEVHFPDVRIGASVARSASPPLGDISLRISGRSGGGRGAGRHGGLAEELWR